MRRLLLSLLVLVGLASAGRAADVGPVLFRLGNGTTAGVFVTPANVVYGAATFTLANGSTQTQPVIGQLIPGVYLWVAVNSGVNALASSVFLFGNGTTITASFGPGLASLGLPSATPLYENPGPWTIVGGRSAGEDDAAGNVLARIRGDLGQ